MALMKEQMASMAKMIENMTALMQASVTTTTMHPVTGVEGQGVPAADPPANPIPWGCLQAKRQPKEEPLRLRMLQHT